MAAWQRVVELAISDDDLATDDNRVLAHGTGKSGAILPAYPTPPRSLRPAKLWMCIIRLSNAASNAWLRACMCSIDGVMTGPIRTASYLTRR